MTPNALKSASMQSAAGRARDIDAAVSFALKETEFASVQSAEQGPGVRVWELVNVKGEPGWLRIEIDSQDEPNAAAPLRISASLGRFGNERLERRLVKSITDRLRELDKRGY